MRYYAGRSDFYGSAGGAWENFAKTMRRSIEVMILLIVIVLGAICL